MLKFFVEIAFCQLKSLINCLINSVFASLQCQTSRQYCKDKNVSSEILHILPDDDSLDVKTGEKLIKLLPLAVMRR